MTEPAVLLERRSATAIITLNRPARANAMTAQLLAELATLERQLAADASVRAVIVTGAGKHFCAGIDLQAAQDASPWTPGVRIGLPLLPQPVIAAINGSAMGGGCELALACDFRVLSADAAMGLPEVRFGELPLGGGTARLARLVGASAAKRMIMLGEPVDSSTALRIGLVDLVVARGAVLDTALELAEQLAGQAAYAVQTAKHLIDASLEGTLDQALERERRMVPTMASPAERAAARAAAAASSPVYARLFPSASGDGSDSAAFTPER